MALISFVLVLGSHTPFFEIAFHWVPGMKYFRVPQRFLMIVDFSLCVLAALCVSQISWGKARMIPWLLLAITIGDLMFFQVRQNGIGDITPWQEPPSILSQLNTESGLYRIYSPLAYRAHMAAFDEAQGWEGDLGPFLRQRESLQPSSNLLYGVSTPDGSAQLTPSYIVDFWGDLNRAGLMSRIMKARPDQLRVQP